MTTHDVTVRALEARDWSAVLRIYGEGIATGLATFETTAPTREHLEAAWLVGHRWVTEVGHDVVGWTAATRVSSRDCYAGVVETAVYVADGQRGRGVGSALLRRQVAAADADDGLWTLQASIISGNAASIALHRAAGYRTVGVRERIARRDGVWHDSVLLERRSPTD